MWGNVFTVSVHIVHYILYTLQSIIYFFHYRVGEQSCFLYSLVPRILYYEVIILTSLKLHAKYFIDLIQILSNIYNPDYNRVNTKHGELNLSVLFDRTERHAFESRLMLLLVNNVVQKMRRRVTNTISLYELTNVFFIFYLF